MNLGINNKHFQSFHIPTPLNRKELSFCESNVDAFRLWTTSLSARPLGDRSAAIFTALHELSSLICTETERFDMLQELHPFIEHVLSNIEKNFITANSPQAERQTQLVDLDIQMRMSLIQLYIDIAFRCNKSTQNPWQFWRHNENHNIKVNRILSCYYALQHMGYLLLQQQLNYLDVLINQWRYTHEIYQYAFKNNEHLININRIQGSRYAFSNIQECYIQILLLDICYTYQIRPNEIQALYECGTEWIHLIELSHRNHATSRYMIDSQQDLPPIFNHKQQQFFLADHYLSTHNLLEHINNTIQNNAKNLTDKEKKYLSTSLKFHIQNVLGTTSIERRYPRYQHSAELEISLGLETAHFLLSHPHYHSDHIESQQTNPNMCNLFLITHDPSLEISSPISPQLNKELKQIYTAQVLDMSSHGYRIQWDSVLPQNLQNSELIILREKNDINWKVGIIRWMKKSYQNNFAIGLEVLSDHVFACNVRLPRQTLEHPPMAGLLFAHTYTGRIQLSIVLPNFTHLNKIDSFHLELHELKIQLLRKKTLMVTQSFIQFEIQTQNIRQLPILRELLDRLMAQL
ncbi:hypothetical protein RFH42_02560 [Acinetobacter rudis]|uniref:hypothetical protein n=1 Tax=Acinetobacter rudis TaxID=632955 RepID=UPI00280C61DB|nr:hypothetical protein [Acinetobacter rudis]MDQ8951838.1 hypothetical protein [Acinetobacter rudis]